MIETRTATGRGTTDLGWLDSRHTFAFGMGLPDRSEPHPMGFRSLRVINDDRIAPGAGFGTHPHDNMEIISFVIDGALEHKDSMGTRHTVRPGDFQYTAAGTGITHSEYNPDPDNPGRFIQIWIIPNQQNAKPRYDHRTHDPAASRNTLRLVASPDGANGSMTINADARLLLTQLDTGAEITHTIPAGRAAWVQVAQGTVRLRTGTDEITLAEGDGAAITDEDRLTVAAAGHTTGAEVLLFDLA